MRFIKNIVAKTPSHIITAVAAVTLIGGITSASAHGHDNEQPPAPPTPAPVVVADPSMDPLGLSSTVCATAPKSNAKFQVFQDLNYGYAGANDRMELGNTYKSRNNNPTPTSVQTYDAEGRTRNTKVTEVKICVVTVKSFATGEVDPTYGYPIYDNAILDASWQTLFSDKSGKHTVHAIMPQFNTNFDPSGDSYTYTYMVSAFVGGRGSGNSVSSYVPPFYGGK